MGRRHVLALGGHHFLDFQKGAVPDIESRVVRFQARPRQPRQNLGNGNAVGDRRELLAPPDVQQVHRRRITLLDFQGPHVQLALVAVDIAEQLRGVENRRGGVERVVCAHQREIGDRFKIVQIGAGQHEKIAQHLVAVPVRHQIGQAIEHVVSPPPAPFDGFVDFAQKRLEAVAGVERPHFRPWTFGHQRRMAGEMEIDQLPSFVAGVLAKRLDQRSVIVDAIHLPDDVVARHDPPKNPVQARYSGADLRVDRRHYAPFAT